MSSHTVVKQDSGGPSTSTVEGGKLTKGATQVIAQSGGPVAVGGTLAEVTLMSCTIPKLGPNDALRITYLTTYPLTTNTKTLRPKLGGTTIFSANRTTTTASLDSQIITLYNRNATNSQILGTGIGAAQQANPITMSVDTSIPQTFSITGQTTLETGFTPTAANMSGNGTTVTVNQTAHGLHAGEYIQAAGSSTAGYNVDPVLVTVVNANQFTYAGTGTGTPGTAPTIKRYSPLQLEGYTIELLPGA